MSCHNLDECIIACPTCGNNRRTQSPAPCTHCTHGQSTGPYSQSAVTWAFPAPPPLSTYHYCLPCHPTSISSRVFFWSLSVLSFYYQNIFQTHTHTHTVLSQRMQLTANASINYKYLHIHTYHPKAPQSIGLTHHRAPSSSSSSMGDPNYSIRFYLFLIFWFLAIFLYPMRLYESSSDRVKKGSTVLWCLCNYLF